MTPTCLASLQENDQPLFATIVVDNASTDGSRDDLETLDGKSIELIKNSENVGFAKACNQAMLRACELGADFAFLCNNDARLKPDALTELISAATKNPKAALIGGKIYFGDGPNLWCAGMNVGFYPNLQELRGFGKADDGQFDTEEDVDALTGCGLLLRREFIEAGGYFDEDFFVYVEDLELSLRAKSMGWTCRYVPTSIFYHDAGSTSGQGYSAWRKYMLAYNLVVFLKKRGTAKLWISFLILDVLCWPLVLLSAIARGRVPGALAKARGLLHAFLNRDFNPS